MEDLEGLNEDEFAYLTESTERLKEFMQFPNNVAALLPDQLEKARTILKKENLS